MDDGSGDYKETITPELKKTRDTAHYDLDMYFDIRHDTMFYQMTRPHEERSWTCVINNYTKRGHLHFFSSFFYLTFFGRGIEDLDFLAHCWTKWDMPGPFLVDKLVKAHIEQVKEDESLGPKVYQNDIKSLIHLFNINQWP